MPGYPKNQTFKKKSHCYLVHNVDSSLIDLGFDIHVTLFPYLQPEDWDDKEYIPDPEDEKPKVFVPHITENFQVFCLKMIISILHSLVMT